MDSLMEENKWSKLLPELLELISDRLPLHDFIRFRSVCRHWHSSPSGRAEIAKFSKDDSLWLLFYDFETKIDDDGTKCYLYNKSHPDCCAISIPHIRGANVVHSKFGWLLAHRNDEFFLYQPFSFIRIDLPKHSITSDQVYAFTTLPIYQHCIVFIVSRREDSKLEVSYCEVGHTTWTTHSADIDKGRIGRMQYLTCCCNCLSPDCRCRRRYHIDIRDENRKLLLYNCKKRAVQEEGVEKTLGKLSQIDETNKRHCEDWFHRFKENRLLVATCAVDAINENPSIDDGVYGLKAWTDQMVNGEGEEEEEEEKFKWVKAAWIEPIYTTKEMKLGFSQIQKKKRNRKRESIQHFLDRLNSV